jgi:multisubunit Na+/H+ antiporter MnhF subunit
MNGWMWAAAVLLVLLLPCALAVFRRPFEHGLVGLQVAGPIGSVALLLVAEGTGRQPFGDLALTLAVASFAGSLLLARFLERLRDPEEK